MSEVKVSVVIVSYNSKGFIEKCINSVLKNLSEKGEVIVLDNFSTDKTVEILKKSIPKIKLLKSDENLGFAKGCNKAVKEAKGEYLFLLNPDTEMSEPIIVELIKFYETTVDAGIVVPKLIMLNGQSQASVRKLPTLWGAFKEYILGITHAYSEYVPEGDKPQEVEMAYGAAWLIKKDLFDKLNGFNKKFFLYYEDVDFCRRLKELGKKIYYYPQVSIKHLVGATKSEQDKYKLNLESAKKYHGWFKFVLLQLIFKLSRLKVV